jgi:hypothetical protein
VEVKNVEVKNPSVKHMLIAHSVEAWAIVRQRPRPRAPSNLHHLGNDGDPFELQRVLSVMTGFSE